MLGRRTALGRGRHPGGDDEWSTGSLEGCANGFDRLPVGLVGGFVLIEVVDERQVDDTVGLGRPLVQAVEILERAAMHLGSCRRQCVGRSFGASETNDVMAGIDKLGHHGRADPTGPASDEYAHQ
jgi:hypothetical protein